jgi:hypothetical protein
VKIGAAGQGSAIIRRVIRESIKEKRKEERFLFVICVALHKITI